MRLVFAGTPDFAAEALRALIDAGHDIALVITQPDRPSGRGMRVQASAVKQVAVERVIPVAQPRGLRIGGKYDDDARAIHDLLRATPHDAMVVAAYGLIVPSGMLTIARHGCINIHASLLPRWRGAAPIQRAIEAGDRETGITIMQMDAGLDTGAILSTHRWPIAATATGASLTSELATLGGEAIVAALPSIESGTLVATPQHAAGDESSVTYAAKLVKSEGRLDFGRSARCIVDRIRAFDPWPGCQATLFDDALETSVPFKIWKAEAFTSTTGMEPGSVVGLDPAQGGVMVATGDGTVVLTELQKPGGRRLAAGSFTNDFARLAGLRFMPTPLD